MNEKPKIMIIDTYYREFLRSIQLHRPLFTDYETSLEWLMEQCFGTFDAYSRGLSLLGWETMDVIANCDWLQSQWQTKYGKPGPVLHQQIMKFNPNVLFLQDLHAIPPRDLARYRDDYWIAGQLSCPWPGDEVVSNFDVLFTSFPHYLPRFVNLGVKCAFVPLAFDPAVHARLSPNDRNEERIIDVSFVGGMGKQFGEREKIVDYMLKYVPGFRDFGYGGSSAPAWGLDMYRVYRNSKIVLNIHHPAAEGFSNNLRMFEATGMGALLLTETSPNIEDYFKPGIECVTYPTLGAAIRVIRDLLDHQDALELIAAAGQKRTLSRHTYDRPNRLPIVSAVLQELLS